VDHFRLGGVQWQVPIDLVTSKSTVGAAQHSVLLTFELPSFTPVNSNDFANSYPDDDKPIISVMITDDPNVPFGQKLLDKLMAKVANCGNCAGDSALGGKQYTNYEDGLEPGWRWSNGVPYNLYVNRTPAGNWFAVCYFKPNLAPLPCEVTERLSTSLIITYKFPQEYLAQAFVLGAKVRLQLAQYQSPPSPPSQADVALARPQPSCWAPPAGSLAAQTIPLRVGPQQWHIPRAYAATFGSNQTQNPLIQGFQIFLKLPDLQPVTARDPSPYEILGPGQYITIGISYDGRPGAGGSIAKPGPGGKMQFPLLQYIGRSSFLDYEEFVDEGITRDLYYDRGEYLWFISPDPARTPNTFPPQYFICNQFSPGSGMTCKFDVWKSVKSTGSVNTEPGAYLISYWFSRAYLSQMETINKCVGKLYESFTSGNGG
jgi:hypothetical protein